MPALRIARQALPCNPELTFQTEGPRKRAFCFFVQRGNDRQACFVAEPDYIRHLTNLHEAIKRGQSAFPSRVIV